LQIAACSPSQLFEALVERHQPAFGLRIISNAHQYADARDFAALLRARRERPRGCRANRAA
jgi:hypothetical protein